MIPTVKATAVHSAKRLTQLVFVPTAIGLPRVIHSAVHCCSHGGTSTRLFACTVITELANPANKQ